MTATGLSNKDMAERLHRLPRTVGERLSRGLPTLGIASRTRALDDDVDGGAGKAMHAA